jgi:RNA polymerase sigma-70 factor (ECF subfamily)
VIAFKAGDETAYDEIYRRHSPKIRAVCSRRLGQPFDADEAVQETFLRAYQALGRFNGQYKLGAWLNRIAVNVCIDEIRSRSRSDIVDDISERMLETERGPDEIIASRRPEVIAALHELKPLHADVLRLRALHDLSHEELAARLQITPAQVKALLHRARSAFKRIVREASGFVVAPLVMLRRGRRGQATLPPGATANVAGLLTSVPLSLPVAERLMTGAVVTVLALAGGAATIDAPAEGSRELRRPRSTQARTDMDFRKRTETLSAPAASITSAPDPEEIEIVDTPDVPVDARLVVEIAEPITEHVEQQLDEHTEDADPRPRVDDDRRVEKLQRTVVARTEAVTSAASGAAAGVIGNP